MPRVGAKGQDVIPDLDDMARLAGHRFPGGEARIEHWENFLLSDATGVAPLPDGLAHPAHLFHVPILGVGTSIAELFRLAEADRAAPVSIDFYDWCIDRPLKEGEIYRFDGGISAHERSGGEAGAPVVDSFTYEIEVKERPEGAASGRRVAHVAFRWHYWRLDR